MNLKNNSGFTLIELLIALVVTLVILGGAYSVFNSQQKNTLIQTNVSDAQQTLRAAMDFMARDIRMANFDPEKSNNFGITDIRFRDFDNAVDDDGNSAITFSWDRNENGTLDAGEEVNFSLSDNSAVAPGSNTLMYGTPNRDPLAGYIVALGLAYAYDADNDHDLDEDAAGNTIWAIDAGNDNDWDSLTVDQAAGTAVVAATGTPVATQDIRAVRIWMLARSEAPDNNYTDSNTYVVGRQVIQPNNNFRHRLLERTVLCRNMGLNL